MNAWPKKCGCGRSYSAEEWLELPAGGRMALGDDEGEIDLRHCVCESTISVLVSDLEEDDRLAFELKRLARIERLVVGAERAVDLALAFAAEDRERGASVVDDHRIIAATRQASEYLRAVDVQRALRFNASDLVLVASMGEQLAAAE
jgi:hypothetical protein